MFTDSATAGTLTISTSRVQKINDPIQQMLHQLHKIIYITQLPPTLSLNMRRRVIEQFKRSLFAQQTNGFNLKNELKKLISGSREMLDLQLSVGEAKKLATQAQEAITAANSKKHGKYLLSQKDQLFRIH